MNRLRFSSFATEYDLRLAIMDAGRIAYERSLVSANDGTISARLGDEMIVITPAGICKGRLDLEDLLVLDLGGNILKRDPKRHLTPPFDLLLYLEIYRARPDVRAIIHAHPRFESALAMQDEPTTGQVDLVKAALDVISPRKGRGDSAPDEAEVAFTRENYVILPAQLGSLSIGEHLEEALMTLEHHEHSAEVTFYARLLAGTQKQTAKK
jgi:L-fuculose-phosphate aldolase